MLHHFGDFFRGAHYRSHIAEDEASDHEVEAQGEHVVHEGSYPAYRNTAVLEELRSHEDDGHHCTESHQTCHEGE